eukprot:CAMPEP_0113566660 /NCGR_PEP_ID=MMETSP0015_2-20120614/22847_1 /TAXON_ID=2838 /ORGANISM="Odontella" /LENGTH=140 /DNA_ID=CAMNT_0000468975 /DNA_START=120 /DNA_END=542 /DNA_ORIENTATION=+ /assembly_acc=CAM_ASM_000160
MAHIDGRGLDRNALLRVGEEGAEIRFHRGRQDVPLDATFDVERPFEGGIYLGGLVGSFGLGLNKKKPPDAALRARIQEVRRVGVEDHAAAVEDDLSLWVRGIIIEEAVEVLGCLHGGIVLLRQEGVDGHENIFIKGAGII